MSDRMTTGYAQSGDVRLFYRKFGNPGRLPLLIVHGLSFFSYDWKDIAADLSVSREVVAIDMRGFGQSSCSPDRDYKLETIGGDVIAVLDALGWNQAILLGHSFGGRVCLATSGWFGSRVAGLVSVDFAPDIAAAGRRRTAESIGRQPDVFATVDEAIRYHGDDDTPERRTRWKAFLRETPDGYVLRRDLHYRAQFRRALEVGASSPVPSFLWDMLAALSVPALFVRGESSDMLEAATLAKVRQINSRIVTIALRGGHDLAGDNPAGLTAAVADFLKGASL